MLLVLLILSHQSLFSTAATRKPRDRPNFLLHFVDDLGYGDLGITGHPTTQTTNIDYLATKGKRLTTWYSGYPVCSASRTALLTGRQPPRVGMPGVINSLGIEGLPLSEETFAARLSSTHKSFILGKWHQGQRPEYLPKARGFDAFYGLPYSVDDGIGYYTQCSNNNNKTAEMQTKTIDTTGSAAVHLSTRTSTFQQQTNIRLGPEIPLPLIRQLPDVYNESSEFGEILEQPTNLVPLSSNMVAFFKNMTTLWRDVPWLAYVAHPHVHTATPNINQIGSFEQYAGCEFAGHSIRGGFGDALSEVDWMVGEMMNHIENLGLSNNTLVLFLSDNGPWMEKHQGGGSLGPFTAMHATYRNVGKGSTWEGGIRSPSFAYWPGEISPFTKTSAVLSSLDVLPTLVSLGQNKSSTAIDDSAAVVLDGQDFSSVLFSSSFIMEKWRRDVLFPFWNGPDFSKPGTEIYAGRYNQYKIHWITSMGLTAGSHQLNSTVRHDPPLVFDIEMDPGEAFPVLLDPLTMKKIQAQRKMKTFVPNAIDPTFGMEWALCCDRATNCTCKTPRVIVPSTIGR